MKTIVALWRSLNLPQRITACCLIGTLCASGCSMVNIYRIGQLQKQRTEILTGGGAQPTAKKTTTPQEEVYAEVRADQIGEAGQLMMWAIRSGGGKWKRAGLREHPTDPNVRLVMRYSD